MSKKVFGLEYLGRKIPELLKIKVEHKNDPDKWTWTPAKPDKIRNIEKEVQKEKESVRKAVITNYKYDSNLKQRVFFSFEMGNLSYSLINNLISNNLKFVYVSFTQLVLKGYIIVSVIKGIEKRFLKIDDFMIDLDDVGFVIWTPPRFPAPLFDFDMIPPRKNRNSFLFTKRWGQLIREFEYLVNREVIWIPSVPFNGSQEWQNKIGEYLIANKIGLKVPDFIFSNCESDIKRFFTKHEKICLREFCSPPYSFPPIIFEHSDKIKLNNIKNSPCTFQEYIEKKYELRVVVVFDNIYPIKIHSQDSNLTKNDWRVHDDAHVKWEMTKLPEKVCNQLLQLGKQLQLNWYSVDLIFSTDNEYVFLEINRPGAHYWLDTFVGFDVSKVIVELVKEKKIIDEYES